MFLFCGGAQAQRWATTAAIDGDVTFTSNGNFGADEDEKSDVIIAVTPRIGFVRAGGNLSLSGDLALPASTYVRGTDASGIDPTFNLNANLEAIENFLFIDASMQLQRTLDNPFGAQTPVGSDVNSQNLFTASVSPYLRGNFGPRLRYQLRNDTSYTKSTGGEIELDSYYALRNLAELELLPRPFGLLLTYIREDSSNQSSNFDYRYSSDIARATLEYSPRPQFLFGLRAGYESNNYPGINSDRSFYGVTAEWRPSERTNLSGFWEDRYFGNAWNVAFDHRMPRLAWSLRSSRDDSTLPQRYLGVPATQNVAALIDASLITRIPDPIERARAVEELIVSRGLPRSLSEPTDIYTDRLEIQTVNTGTVTLIGVRNTLALTFFSTKTEGALSAISSLPPLPNSELNNRQRGVALNLGHRISSVTSVNGEASWRKATGLGSLEDEQTTQQTYQLRFARSLAPNTGASAGVRYQTYRSNVNRDSNETALFVGLSHRF